MHLFFQITLLMSHTCNEYYSFFTTNFKMNFQLHFIVTLYPYLNLLKYQLKELKIMQELLN